MLTVDADAVSALRPFFAPERPGPLIFEHIAHTGRGRCRVDRWPDPQVVLAELPGGNYALRGDPSRMVAAELTDVAGLVEAPPDWLPALRRLDHRTGVWDRVVASLPDATAVPTRPVPPGVAAIRLLGPADAAALAGIPPVSSWIHETWGGAEALASAGVARAAVVDGRPVSIAAPFYVGDAYEDIGVVTDPGRRGRGFSTACAAALVGDIRARGRRPSWTTSPDNAASLAVAAGLGFVREREDVLYTVRVPVPG